MNPAGPAALLHLGWIVGLSGAPGALVERRDKALFRAGDIEVGHEQPCAGLVRHLDDVGRGAVGQAHEAVVRLLPLDPVARDRQAVGTARGPRPAVDRGQIPALVAVVLGIVEHLAGLDVVPLPGLIGRQDRLRRVAA